MTMMVVGSIHDDQPSIQPQLQSRQQDRCEFCKLLIHYSDYKNASGGKIPMDLGTERPLANFEDWSTKDFDTLLNPPKQPLTRQELDRLLGLGLQHQTQDPIPQYT